VPHEGHLINFYGWTLAEETLHYLIQIMKNDAYGAHLSRSIYLLDSIRENSQEWF